MINFKFIIGHKISQRYTIIDMDIESGDHIFYPGQGPGTVLERVTKTVSGEEKDYFRIKLYGPSNKVIMVPIDSLDITPSYLPTEEEVDDLLERLEDVTLSGYDPEGDEPPEKLKQHETQALHEQLRDEGDWVMIEEILRHLHVRHIRHNTNVTENKAYSTAKNYLTGILMALKDIKASEARKILHNSLPTKLPEASTTSTSQ